MQFAIGVIVLECSFVKHSHGPLGVKDLCLYVVSVIVGALANSLFDCQIVICSLI
jgi:hypothetical protein